MTELQRNLHKQKASLAGLRSQYADEKDSTLAAQKKLIKDAQHASQSLVSLKGKALHFKVADEEELRQVSRHDLMLSMVYYLKNLNTRRVANLLFCLN